MKCPKCGAWSRVLDTRGAQRRRECANLHRFSTVEVLPRLVRHLDVAKAKRAAINNADRWQRDKDILSSSLSSAELAVKHGLSVSRVNVIRWKARKNPLDN